MADEQLSQEEFEKRLFDSEDHGKPKVAASSEPAGGTNSAPGAKPKAETQEGQEGEKPKPKETVVIPPVTASLDDLSDEELEAHLAKRGKKVVKAEEGPVLTEAQKKEKREADVLKFGLENGKFTRSVYEAFITDKSKNPRDLVFAQFIASNKDSGKTFEELETEFKDYYYEGVDEKFTHLTARRKKDMEREAAQILRDRYPEIYNLDRAYDEHESTQSRQQRESAVKAEKVKVYTTNLKNVFSTIKHFDLPIKEGDEEEQTVPFDIPDNQLQALEAQFSKPEIAEKFIDATPEQLKDAVEAAILKLNYKNMVSHSSKVYANKKLDQHKIGRKNMIPDEVPAGTDVVQRDEQMYEMLGPEVIAAAKKELDAKPISQN